MGNGDNMRWRTHADPGPSGGMQHRGPPGGIPGGRRESTSGRCTEDGRHSSSGSPDWMMHTEASQTK